MFRTGRSGWWRPGLYMLSVLGIQRQTAGVTVSENKEAKVLSNVIRIDEERIRDHLGKIVRGSLDETLNALPAAGPLFNHGVPLLGEWLTSCG